MWRLRGVRMSGKAVRWGVVIFAILVILGRFGHAPDSGPFPAGRPPAAVAEAAAPVPLKAHGHLMLRVPHRVPWWLRGGYGYGQRGQRPDRPTN